MRKWTGLCVLLICLMALQTACAEGGTTAQMLQDYAGQQAARLERIKNMAQFFGDDLEVTRTIIDAAP